MKTVKLPEKLDLATLSVLSREFDAISESPVTLILGPERFFAPFGLLFLHSKINELQKRIGFQNFLVQGNIPYFTDMRLFELDAKLKPIFDDERKHSFIPITKNRYEDLYKNPADKYKEISDLIQICSDKISDLIFVNQSKTQEQHDVISYCIREIFRNVFEHSEAGCLYFGAQYWKASHKVEISIYDNGIGIKKSIGENPNFRFKTDKEAVEFALLPSVSGKTHRPRTSEIWFNSGYGLFMTQCIARESGNFVIASGNFGVELTKNRKNNCKMNFQGTIIRMNIDIQNINNAENKLGEYRKLGEQISKDIVGSGGRPPSSMSMMLRRQ